MICILCGKHLNRVITSPDMGLTQADGGVEFKGEGFYGSLHDQTTFDGHICDECVTSALEDGRLKGRDTVMNLPVGKDSSELAVALKMKEKQYLYVMGVEKDGKPFGDPIFLRASTEAGPMLRDIGSTAKMLWTFSIDMYIQKLTSNVTKG